MGGLLSYVLPEESQASLRCYQAGVDQTQIHMLL